MENKKKFEIRDLTKMCTDLCALLQYLAEDPDEVYAEALSDASFSEVSECEWALNILPKAIDKYFKEINPHKHLEDYTLDAVARDIFCTNADLKKYYQSEIF